MSYSTALFIFAAILVAMSASYAVVISAYVLHRCNPLIDRDRALLAIVVGTVLAISAAGTALRLAGL